MEPEEINMIDEAISPSYYTKWKVEPISFIIHNDLGYVEGNVIKYIMRHRDKNGLEDLNKAIRYIEMMKEAYYGKKAE